MHPCAPLEAPAIARIPSSPNRPLNLGLGIVLAAFLALGSVFTSELVGDTVHTPRQLEALTGATVLATVPENGRRMISRRGRETAEIEPGSRGELEGPANRELVEV